MAVDGKAIILVSSEMSELLASCDKIVCMFEGKITGILDNKEAERGIYHEAGIRAFLGRRTIFLRYKKIRRK